MYNIVHCMQISQGSFIFVSRNCFLLFTSQEAPVNYRLGSETTRLNLFSCPSSPHQTQPTARSLFGHKFCNSNQVTSWHFCLLSYVSSCVALTFHVFTWPLAQTAACFCYATLMPFYHAAHVESHTLGSARLNEDNRSQWDFSNMNTIERSLA